MAATKQKLPVATAEQFDGLTLMHMRTENIKRVRLVEITLNKTLTQIGGDNAQGKTSFLDSYEWCVGGKTVIQMDPIHHGKQTGSITCDFGDGEKVQLSVTRTLKRLGDTEFTAELDVEIPGYLAPSRIEEFLKSLAGTMLDPMAFDRMTDKERFDALRKFVGDFDFKQNKSDYDKLFAQRTDVKRDMNRAQSAADAIIISADPPGIKIDEDALTAKLTQAGQHNVELERRRNNRQTLADSVVALREKANASLASIETKKADIDARLTRARGELEEQIKALQLKLAALDTDAIAEMVTFRNDAKAAADDANKEADHIQARLDAAEALPDPVDADAISAELNDARIKNRAIVDWEAQRDRKKALQAEADGYSDEADALTSQLADLEHAKKDAIQKAHMPVDGIDFGDSMVMLGGAPWEQASHAERIDASTAIAMALNPKLKVILIRDGSNLGTKMKQRIAERAQAKGYRVLMEVVDDTGGTHVVIEDGIVKALNQPAGAAA